MNFIDSLASIITGIGIFGLIVYARTSGLEIFDPIIRGGFALLFKFAADDFGSKCLALRRIRDSTIHHLGGAFYYHMRIGQFGFQPVNLTGIDRVR